MFCQRSWTGVLNFGLRACEESRACRDSAKANILLPSRRNRSDPGERFSWCIPEFINIEPVA